jgi:hypothetical protein
VVTVALDIDPAQARPWIEAAAPTHPALVDSAHVTNELFGFHNVPMAVWIDETGTLVRPAESASIQPRDVTSPIPDELPERVKEVMAEARRIPDIGAAYRAAIHHWVANGAASPYALEPAEVIAASHPRNRHHAEAAAHFELGRYLFATVGRDAAIPWWREAHRLDPSNWAYKRQAWTLETTPEGEPSDLMQPATEVYEGNWLDDVRASGGGEHYITRPSFLD